MAKTTVLPSNPHFFKFILPAKLQGNLSIPKAFIKDYLEGEKYQGKKAILRTRKSGKSWIVSTKGYCFTDGWEDFAREHGVDVGDLLVFKHQGGFTFEVIVFDATMCEKEYPKVDQLFMEKARAAEEKENKFAQCLEGTARRIKRVKDHSCLTIVIQPSHIDWKTLSIPAKFGRENRLDKNSIQPCMITLKDSKNGKSWKVGLRHKDNGQAILSRGWPRFVNANKFKIGDECTFKLVSNGSKTKIVMEFKVSKNLNHEA
ncbi:B3 domain-containing protein rem8 [Thalictrum thalictroides]|uniref:B3 domain-containing protein rem8 n=1 Tax=Thalictrum thalictroides TaxID=46969 RepID=A0A7J6WG06_THATH|nr:B3 domain-containing protein rem8 [Thalictrum thalictroides]